jgi:hypothetical protein
MYHTIPVEHVDDMCLCTMPRYCHAVDIDEVNLLDLLGSRIAVVEKSEMEMS